MDSSLLHRALSMAPLPGRVMPQPGPGTPVGLGVGMGMGGGMGQGIGTGLATAPGQMSKPARPDLPETMPSTFNQNTVGSPQVGAMASMVPPVATENNAVSMLPPTATENNAVSMTGGPQPAREGPGMMGAPAMRAPQVAREGPGMMGTTKPQRFPAGVTVNGSNLRPTPIRSIY